ncbi:MAG: 50S ribosomal protein L9 [Kiritimatiellae bacterium]|nr:50S ribosomal protein L9 [Kiritimatiellia bacterium]
MVEVMLMADVKKLGKAGAILKVAPGYARNYLFTQGLAAPVTEAAKRRLAKLESERAKERAARRAAAEELAKKLAGLNVNVSARTVDGARLYGSVSATDIVGAITADRGVELDRSQIDLPDQLKEVGEYAAKLDLGEGVFVPFKVKISDEEAAQA